MAVKNRNRHSERATLALRMLAEKDPSFASLSLFCHHRDSDQAFAPAWTNGKTIYYAKQFEAWQQPQQIAVCAHEIMHIAFGHIPRGKRLRQRFRRRFDPRLFNITTDAIINETLREAGYKVPKEGVFLCELLQTVMGEKVTAQDALSKWDTESLYVFIDSYCGALPKLAIGVCACLQEEPEGAASGPSPGANGPDDADGAGQTCSACGAPKQPSARAAVYGYAAAKGYQDDMDANTYSEPLSPEEAQAESEWQEHTLRALNAGRLAGHGIGALGHRLADLPQSRTPWEVILRTSIRKAVSHRRRLSYSQPTRRWLAMDSDARQQGARQPAYEPSLSAQNDVPRVAVGIDVSGSISNTLLEKFAAEIVAIGKRTGAEIHVLVFDTLVISHTKMKHGNWKSQITEVDFARGGGTDFHDVIERAQDLAPSIIVVLTDLEGPVGDAPKNTPVIWACPSSSAPQPKFGKVVSLSN
ncbi:vWA domain-containing protein [Phaeobacter inhibens]|uniref:vWA domain-containing protein n=1 Tax=Phaeobacter inhibens TaxID=221822 RepID=UPI0021A4DF2C|nr:VWA-like domain-containing protein [Phaeobacter inhibens]UWR59233.1 hypothetical protein K4F88_09755 [Phaeobacter inhibens]